MLRRPSKADSSVLLYCACAAGSLVVECVPPEEALAAVYEEIDILDHLFVAIVEH